MGVASGCGEQEAGVVSGSGWKSIGVATGRGCKEVYRFPHSIRRGIRRRKKNVKSRYLLRAVRT